MFGNQFFSNLLIPIHSNHHMNPDDSADLQAIATLHRGTLAETLGVSFIHAEKARIMIELPMGPHLATIGGGVHGGTLMAFADIAGALLAGLNLPAGTRTSTMESKQNFVGSIREGVMQAEATLLHSGSRTMVTQTRVTNKETGKLLAIVTQTQMTLPL
jgi:1,4-dihydroxy-2-naphthoyl-CoA hydrolase